MGEVSRDRVVEALRALGPRGPHRARSCTARDARILRGISFRSRVERRRRRLMVVGIVLVLVGEAASLVAVATGCRVLAVVDAVCVVWSMVCLTRAYHT